MAFAAMPSDEIAVQNATRVKKLQTLGVLCGFTAGAWLGTAEAPTKLVSIGVSPIVISLIMVIGVFLARWSLPALILGTSAIRADVQRAPHLIIWAVLAGCMWAVANTMTIFAIRDIGLSIAFPLWNSNSLLGIFWGFVFFRELRQAGWRRWTGVLGGALVMCLGASLLALASSTQAPVGHSMRGVWAALGAGVLWGTMYIPYRKAYLSGMNPLSFVAFFTFGELGMMAALTVSYLGLARLWQELVDARAVLFWLMAGGFIWVIGDVFQQYAAKYLGISRGIPLSNSNQLWGLLWGIFVFGELHGNGVSTYMQVVGGSLLMMLGVGAIAFSSATLNEQAQWRAASERECQRYGMNGDYVEARMQGASISGKTTSSRSPLDWLLVACATGVFIVFATMARSPNLAFHGGIAASLSVAILILLGICGVMLWRTTRFN
jgi:drug/metabolite transporter (DMT)-like permease